MRLPTCDPGMFLRVSNDQLPDWQAELAKGSEIERQAKELVQAALGFSAGPGRAFVMRLRRAAGAVLTELTQPVAVVVELPTFGTTVTAHPLALVVASGGIALPKIRFSGQGTVQNPADGHAERGIGQILGVMLVAIVTSGLMGIQGTAQAVVDHYLTVIGTLLPVAVYIWNKNNQR